MDACGPREDCYRADFMNKYKDRLATFTSWPIQLKQKPEDLAHSGFFYTDRGDRVQCFMCLMTISRWTTEDQPMAEHFSHSPSCKYINMITDVDHKNYVVEREVERLGLFTALTTNLTSAQKRHLTLGISDSSPRKTATTKNNIGCNICCYDSNDDFDGRGCLCFPALRSKKRDYEYYDEPDAEHCLDKMEDDIVICC
jgi:hypothetical protein